MADSNKELAGRELDAAIAERVMGRRVVWFDRLDSHDGEWSQSGPLETKEECRFRPVAYWQNQEGQSLWEVRKWSPSDSISAAMEVVEKMNADGWSFACTLYEGKLPYASFCKRTAASSRNAEAESLPVAICRAALLAVESVKGEQS